jgi:hypothetical protein
MSGSRPRSTRLSRLLTPLVAAVVVSGTVVAVQQMPAAGGRPAPAGAAVRPETVWESALQGRRGLSPDVTVRQLARASVAAHGLRVRFGNPFGEAPVNIRNAWLGLPVASGLATLLPGSNRRITFHGRPTVSIGPGTSVLSDPVPVDVRTDQELR